jgi:hypothetical protein
VGGGGGGVQFQLPPSDAEDTDYHDGVDEGGLWWSTSSDDGGGGRLGSILPICFNLFALT